MNYRIQKVVGYYYEKIIKALLYFIWDARAPAAKRGIGAEEPSWIKHGKWNHRCHGESQRNIASFKIEFMSNGKQ